MFGLFSFFRGKEPHYLDSVKAADLWIGELAQRDGYEAHKMLVEALSTFIGNAAPLSRQRLKVLMRLDECSLEFQRDIARKYLECQGRSQRGEYPLWKSAAIFFRHLADGYQAFFRDIVANRDNSVGEKYLPLVVARTLHYCGMAIRWGYFRQETVQPVMWRRLHKSYLLSEASGFAEAEVALSSGALTTCGREYAQILLLDVINPACLRPLQIELAGRWLDDWSGLVKLEKRCDPAIHMHCVDLSAGGGARKLVDGANGDALRCWGMADLYGHLRKVRAGLSKGGEIRDLVPEGMDCSLPECLALLDDISRHWVRPAPARKQERMASDKAVEMACGVGAIRHCLQPEGAKKAAGKRPASYQYWAVENESQGGYGLVEAKPAEKAEPGKLVCVKTTGSGAAWEIGVVRWKKGASGQPALGIEKLSDEPKHVELSPAGEPSNGGEAEEASGGKTISAVFLPKWYDREIDSSLIFHPPDYADGRQLDMHYRNNVIRIRLTEVVDKTEEWVRVKFDILGHRSAATRS